MHRAPARNRPETCCSVASSRSKRAPAALVCAVLATSAPAQTTQPAAVSAVVSQLRAGNPSAALDLAQKALGSHSGDCQLLSLEGVAFAAQQQGEKALESFHHALTHCPKYLPALEGAAQLEYARKSPEAIPLLQRVLAQTPNNPPAEAMLATSLARAGNCTAALPRLATLAAILGADHPELQQTYATCLADSGDVTAALGQYKSLAAQHPTDAYQYDIAVLTWRNHDGQGAVAALQPLLNAGTFEPAFSLASRIAESLGDTAHAVEWLRTAIVLAPDNIDNYLAFANLAFVHSSFQVGIDVLNAGVARLPTAAPLLVARGVLEVQLSQEQQAIADFQQAHKLDPQLSLSTDALGIVKSQQHQDQASVNLFRQGAAQHPDDPIVQYLLAEQISSHDSTDANLLAAIAAAKRATELDPQYEPAHNLLAQLYLRAQKPTLAIEQAKLALAQDPNDQEALYQELMASRRSGDRAAVKALVARLNAARKQNADKQHDIDQYRLVEGAQP